MRDTDVHAQFTAMKQQMLAAGVSSSHVTRMVAELRDHLEDIESEAGANGISLEQAASRLGDPDVLVNHVLARPELKSWVYRYPRIARAYLPMEYALLLPLAPLFAGAKSASAIARWGAALFLSAAVTAAMLLIMQLSITHT